MGKPISDFQAISFKIARMEARVRAARLAWMAAAALMVKGLDFRKEAYIAKLISSEAAMDNARDAPRSTAATASERVPRRPPLPRLQDPRDR